MLLGWIRELDVGNLLENLAVLTADQLHGRMPALNARISFDKLPLRCVSMWGVE